MRLQNEVEYNEFARAIQVDTWSTSYQSTAVWDPHQLKSTQLLENVQKFAGRVITQDWSTSYPFLCSSLDLKPLSIRRRMQKLKLCFKILRKESCIPPTAFTPHHNHLQEVQTHAVQLFTPFVPTHAHKSSFFIDVIKHWNALPDEIVSAQTPLIFKNHLHRLYCLIHYFLH